MEDKKYSFSNVTVRIYEEDFLKLVSEVFRKTENQFANSKSAFVVHYFKKGFEGDNHSDGNSSNAEVIKEVRELRKSIDNLVSCLRAEKTSKCTNEKDFIEVQSAIIELLKVIAEELGLDEDLLNGKGM